MLVRRIRGIALIVVCVGALGLAGPARAGDVVFANNGFESGLAGWSPVGIGGTLSAVTDQHYAGTRSGRVEDRSSIDATGLQSPSLPFTVGKRYVAAARVLASSGKPDLYLQFLKSDGVTVLATSHTSFSGVLGSWYPIQTPVLEAPLGAARMVIKVYSSKSNQGIAYWDQVSFSAAGETDLGVQVDNSLPIGTTFGTGAQQHLAYGVITAPRKGISAELVEIDVNSGRAVGRGSLPGALGSSVATTASDGTIYLGANVNGRLYRYLPTTGEIVDVGRAIPTDGHIWSLAADQSGRVYGGTSDEAGFFAYRPGDPAIANLGTPVDPAADNDYLRGMVFDPRPGHQAVYLGLGYKEARLLRYDPVTRQLQSILPAQYAGEKNVTGLTFTGDRLFARIGSKIAVIAVNKTSTGAITTTVEAELTTTTQEVSPARNGRVYYVHGERLYSYDIATRQAAQVIPAVAAPYRTNRFALVRLTDQTNYPGLSVVAIGNKHGQGLLFKYNPTSDATVLTLLTGGPKLPNNISTIGVGPDGFIYSGGHLTGGLAAYEPMLDASNDALPPTRFAREIDQLEGTVRHKGVLYLGTYPGASLLELRPGSGSPDPSPLPGLGAIGNGQDRPYAMVAGDGKLFVGTHPAAGVVAGALTVYDIASRTGEVIRGIVPNQSPVALAYHNGVLWGGTTVRPGYDAGDPQADQAVLFSYHPGTRVVREYTLPAPRLLRAVTALLVVDGKLWGFAEGFFFVFDPVTGRFSIPPTEVFPEVNYSETVLAKDAKLIATSRDSEHIYGNIGTGSNSTGNPERFFKIKRDNFEVTTIKTYEEIDDLTTDDYGNIYFTCVERLLRYIPDPPQ